VGLDYGYSVISGLAQICLNFSSFPSPFREAIQSDTARIIVIGIGWKTGRQLAVTTRCERRIPATFIVSIQSDKRRTLVIATGKVNRTLLFITRLL